MANRVRDHILECSIAHVAIQMIRRFQIVRDVKIHPAVVVEVPPCRRQSHVLSGNSGVVCYVFEVSLAVVAIQTISLASFLKAFPNEEVLIQIVRMDR